jgi:transposase
MRIEQALQDLVERETSFDEAREALIDAVFHAVTHDKMSVSEAARLAHVQRSTVYAWLRERTQ